LYAADVPEPRVEDRRAAGLCGTCLHARLQKNARGGVFWRCALADRDPRFMRYPPLPVLRCEGHERSKLEPPLTEGMR
jgi:hypothetical protein